MHLFLSYRASILRTRAWPSFRQEHAPSSQERFPGGYGTSPRQSCPSAWMPKDLFLGCRGPISMTWSKIDGEPCLSAGCGYSFCRSTPISRLQRCPHPNISFRIPGGPSLDRTAHHKGGWAVYPSVGYLSTHHQAWVWPPFLA